MCSAYETPLGDLTIDSDFNQKLAEEAKFKQMTVKIDE